MPRVSSRKYVPPDKAYPLQRMGLFRAASNFLTDALGPKALAGAAGNVGFERWPGGFLGKAAPCIALAHIVH